MTEEFEREGAEAGGPSALTPNLKDIAAMAPIPMVIHQNWIVVWCNQRAEEMMRELGFMTSVQSMVGFNTLNFLPPVERVAAEENRAQILAGGDAASPPVFRTFMAPDGRTHKMLGSGTVILWKGAPAVLISMVHMGEVTPAVVSTGRHAHNVPPAETLSSHRERLEALSPRELEISLLLAEGFTPVNVASILGTTEHTVRTQIKSIYRKLEIAGRAELVRLVVGAGLGD